MISEFDKAVNANVYAFSSYAAREKYYKNLERYEKTKTLQWFHQRYGVEFVVFEQIKEKGVRQRACIRCNNCYLRLKKSGEYVYDDEIDDDDFDAGTVYPVW